MTLAHRPLFYSAAAFNFIAATPLLLATDTMAGQFGFEMTGTARLFIQMFACVALAFGWAYAMIGRDPVYYRPYILLGMWLKIMVVVFVTVYWRIGAIGWQLPAIVIGDVIFAALFFAYYRQTAKVVRR
jgi:hypothetical protein